MKFNLSHYLTLKQVSESAANDYKKQCEEEHQANVEANIARNTPEKEIVDDSEGDTTEEVKAEDTTEEEISDEAEEVTDQSEEELKAEIRARLKEADIKFFPGASLEKLQEKLLAIK